ncbi:uncharacterized protein Dana_GF12243 [Drosophila ananassae]|uniref:Serpin domain-containing protein n=1 Tax=Drosophila ananassae TaxID=7217 RepID=B3MI50_DROAN|nr:serine protease inhibitor 42Dd [Drosophila ananassae]EDV35895.1 uncharacterized protein Dana_GF12243 [Drosophila ananassae]
MASKCMILLALLVPLLNAQTFNQPGYPGFGLGARFGGGQVVPQQDLQAQEDIRVPSAPRQRNGGQSRNPAPTAPTRAPVIPKTSFMDRFSSKLYAKIAPAQAGSNFVYSPVSVHSILALIYGTSFGKTRRELKSAGEFVDDQIDVAMIFEKLIKFRSDLGNVELKMATKLYHNQLKGGAYPGFPEFSQFYFNTADEAVDMTRAKDTSEKINFWVSDSTDGKIRNLAAPSDITEQTEALLVNAIYFKGRWENEFATMDTQPSNFKHSDGRISSVAMMYNDDVYSLADIPELGASALGLNYRDSNISMLILLPKQVNGLRALEAQLADPQFDLNRIAARLQRQNVLVRLPKFRIEFDQDMTQPLKQMDVQEMFGPKSQIKTMLNDRVRVEKILQKAFIDVNEAGTEAAAASYAKFVPLSLPAKSPEFTADHPFVFAIRTPTSVLFIGHVEHPTPLTASPEGAGRGRQRSFSSRQ